MKKAFTLIELLIVIAVIAILVGMALPRFRGMQEEGNIAKAKGELRALQAAVESYYMHNNNTLPTTLSNLTNATTIPNIIGTTLPKDPFSSGGTSDYGFSTSGNYYVIFSVGPGTTPGSASVTSLGAASDTQNAIYVTNGSPGDMKP